MAAFTEETVETILAACGDNAASLAESLSRCLERDCRIALGESGVWSADELPDEFRGPGIVALIQVELQTLAVLIPSTLPLPEWYRSPDASQAAQLESLAKEWSQQLIPATMVAENFQTSPVEDLATAVTGMKPAPWAATLMLQVSDAADSAETTTSPLLVVWPLEISTVEPASSSPSEEARPAMPAPPPVAQRPLPVCDPLARLRHLPIEVSVRLAEKKIPMSQLLGIMPGMLITFNKSCDDLLDLYVSNARYCRGEAVKIGENFGLKINQVGVPDESERKVIDA